MSATAIRGKDWTFNALWAVRSGHPPPKCLVSIPLTSIWRDGRPFKTLGNDASGSVTRIILEDFVIERNDAERGFRGESYKAIRALRQLLLDYSDSNGYGAYQTKHGAEEPFIANVFYLDGQRESIALHTLDILLRNEGWRKQVMLLQGFVAEKRTHAGTYSHAPVVIGRGEKNEKKSPTQEAVDNFTRILAKFAERAYSVGGAMLGVEVESPVTLRIMNMTCHFAQDAKKRLVFSFSDFVSVEIDKGRAVVEEYISTEKKGRQASAAASVAAELHALLQHAGQRGLGLQENFAHFDPTCNGYIDTQGLIDGLAQLGIGVTYPVGEAVVEVVGGIGSGYISEAAFEQFLQSAPPQALTQQQAQQQALQQAQKRAGVLKLSSGTASSSGGGKTGGARASGKGTGKGAVGKRKLDDAPSFSSSTFTVPSSSSPKRSQAPPSAAELTAVAASFMDLTLSQAHEWQQLQLETGAGTGHRARSVSRGSSSVNKSSVSPSRQTGSLEAGASGISGAGAQSRPSSGRSAAGRAEKRTNRVMQQLSQSQRPLVSRSVCAPSAPTLQGIVQRMSEELNRDADELLHIDLGVIMTYRIVEGPRSAPTERKRGEREVAESKSSKSRKSAKGSVDASESKRADPAGESFGEDEEKEGETPRPFTLIVLPDLFGTLQSLQAGLEALLVKYPAAQLVLVGLPGLPHTVWPEGWVLNADLHSRATAKLLRHLLACKRIESEQPVFFMAMGSAANCLARFVTLYLPALPELRRCTRAVVVVNGTLRFNKRYRLLCQDLRQAMLQSEEAVVRELVNSLHFFDDFLLKNGRQKCLQAFWGARAGLQGGQGGKAFFGVLELLRGVLVSPDDFDGAQLLLTDIPVLAVQCTEDLFVDPRNAAVFQADQLPPERSLVTDISNALSPSAVHVSWLRAGHEVLQERNAFLLGLLSQIAQLCGIAPTVPPPQRAPTPLPGEVSDVRELASRGKTAKSQKPATRASTPVPSAPGSPDSTARSVHLDEQGGGEEEEEEELTEEEQQERDLLLMEEQMERQREKERQEKIEADRVEGERQAEETRRVGNAEDERVAAQQAKAADKLKLAQVAIEAKKRELQQSRESHALVLAQRVTRDLERKMEGREALKMLKEDERSKRVEQFLLEQIIFAMQKQLAKARAEDLAAWRSNDVAKQAMLKAKAERLARIEVRRLCTLDILHTLRLDEQALSGENNPEEGARTPVELLITQTCSAMRGLLERRQQCVESMCRQSSVHSKTVQFRKELATVDNDERRLRRAIKLIELNPAVVGVEMNAESQLEDLRQTSAQKQALLARMTKVMAQRETQLRMANASVKRLRDAVDELAVRVEGCLAALNDSESELTSRYTKMKMERESHTVMRDRKRLLLRTHQQRADTVDREIMRVQHFKGKLIDTDVWVAGVMQRCETKQLKKHLHKERDLACAARDAVVRELLKNRVGTFDVLKQMVGAKLSIAKLADVVKVVFKMFKQFRAVRAEDILDSLQQRQGRAELSEILRNKEIEVERAFSSAGSNSTVARVRLKESEIRTKDERQFVGMDVAMHPEAYIHVSAVEAAQMQFDAAYHCALSKTDLDRIVQLPDQISLALPFLHTAEEVNAHRVLNLFWKERSEQFFRDRDCMGVRVHQAMEDGDEDLASVGSDKSEMSFSTKGMTFMASQERPGQGDTAQILHDVTTREARLDVMRAAAVDEPLSEEEQRFLVLDRILCPHVYDPLEQSQAVIFRRDVHSRPGSPDASLRTSSKHKSTSSKKNGQGLVEYVWRCGYTQQQLLDLRALPPDALLSDEAAGVRALMEQFYVHGSESVMGHSTLKMLAKNIARLATSCGINDKQANRELRHLRSAHASAELADQALAGSLPTNIGDPSALVAVNPSGADLGATEEGPHIPRAWGSFAQVHPASAGKESQSAYFHQATFDASRDHPACFAERVASVYEELSDDDSLDVSFHDLADPETFMYVLSGEAVGPAPRRKHNAHAHFHICESFQELALTDPRHVRGKIVLLQQAEPVVLLDVQGAKLQGRQSRSHYFNLPVRDSVRALDVTVSIIYQGEFEGKGYKLGRLAAALFRLPPEDKQEHDPHGHEHGHEEEEGIPLAAPEPVGFSPYSMQSPNLPTAMGRLVILHKPQHKPLPAGTFQLVVGAASNANYSVRVTCSVGCTALPLVDVAITTAKRAQGRLPNVLMEMDSVQESVRLARKKHEVAQKLIKEAEAESERNRKGMRIAGARIEEDDEEMTMMDDERREVQRELAYFELEYAQWANLFSTRCQEREAIEEGEAAMHVLLRGLVEDKNRLKRELETARRDLPACMMVLRTTAEAVNTALSLNTAMHGNTEEDAADEPAGGVSSVHVSTPAEDVRRHVKQYGLSTSSQEEQQWCQLDQALNPGKYEWMRELEEKERAKREEQDLPPEEKVFDAALEDFKMTKAEIEYVMVTPFSMLTRKEMAVRKLLAKFHDDKEVIRKAIAAVQYNFDPQLAERTRAKNPKAYSREELHWASIDRVLHPEVWAYYVNRSSNLNDRHSKDADKVASKKIKRKKGKVKALKNEAEAAGEGAAVGGEAKQTATAIATLTSAAPVSEKQSEAQSQKEEQGTAEGMAMVEAQGAEQQIATFDPDALDEATGALVPTPPRVPLDDLWVCLFDRSAVIRIWRTPKHFLTDEHEIHCYQLLQQFNGTYRSYMDMVSQGKRRQANFTQEGSHIQWEKGGKQVSKDSDFRARQFLREMDRAQFTRNEWISSNVLHANDQKFPTVVLLSHMEEALETLLTEQIRDRERADKIRVDSSDSENDEEAAIMLAVDEDDDSFEDSDKSEEDEKQKLNKIRRKAKKREKRQRKLKIVNPEGEKGPKRGNKKGANAMADAILADQLGVSGCLACRTRRCRWEPSADKEVCDLRKDALDVELNRVRQDRDSEIFQSDVALSVQLGGNRVFRRRELIDELSSEQTEIGMRLDLNNVDRELHDAYGTRSETFTCQHLHGYHLLMWTNNARQALEARQSRLCAMSVAKEVVDDILDWMLEGWYFGERESQYRVLGYVPTIRKKGRIRAGQDQISTVAQVVVKMKERADKRRKKIATAESTRGLMLEKAVAVEEGSQQNIEREKMRRMGSDQEHLLNETENTLRFGFFMMTLMYFRAMTLLKREQKSWSGEGEDVGVKDKRKVDKLMTSERMRMNDEENREEARRRRVEVVMAKCRDGQKLKEERGRAERRAAILAQQATVQLKWLKRRCILYIQKMYRGHLGRRAARKWALKRAELGAMHALLNSTAITIQRNFRGYRSRLLAAEVRMEMAQFIAYLRLQEAEADEEQYWTSHPWTRFKRNRKEWVKQKMEKYRGTGALGALRLSEAEQAELEGKTLAQIQREMAGMDEEEEAEESEYGDNADYSTISAGPALSVRYGGGSVGGSVRDLSEG